MEEQDKTKEAIQFYINMVFIVKDLMMTSLMQSADMFESFKVVGKIYDLQTSTTTKAITPRQYTKMLHAKMLKTKKEEVIMWHIVSVVSTNGDAYMNNAYVPFVDTEVSVVSNGRNFFLLVDYLKDLLGESFCIEEGDLRKIKRVVPNNKIK